MNTAANKEIEVPEDDDEIEIEIVDDTPEQDRGKPRRAEGAEPEIPEDDEIASYSESVQKRIKKLKYEFHEERRAKEEASRIREEAIRYAETIHKENERLRKSLQDGEGMLLNQAKGRLQAELDRAKASYKEALELGDTDRIIEAQEKLSAVQAEKYRYDSYRPAPQQPQQQPQQFMPQKPQVKKPDPEAEDWARNNEWFGQNEEMTGYAFGVHERVVKSGVAPNSKKYYEEIDTAMRKRFPEEFDDGTVEVRPQPSRQAGNVVAPAGRSPKTSRNKVTLTPSALALAKRFGLTPQQYAAQMLKDRQNGQ